MARTRAMELAKKLAPATKSSEISLMEPETPEDIWKSQPSAMLEQEMNEANHQGKKYSAELPFSLGIHKTTGEIDKEGFKKHIEDRKKQYLVPPSFDSGGLPEDEIEEAAAVGIDPHSYKKSRVLGAPHDYIMKVFTRSARLHPIQKAPRENTKMFNSQEPGKELSPYVPSRVAVIDPKLIGHAHQAGISPDELMEAWHNDGFHPLRGQGYDHPIEKYIAAREMTNHADAKELLSSLKHIDLTDYKMLTNQGHSHREILDTLDDYKDVKPALGEGQKEIGTTSNKRFNSITAMAEEDDIPTLVGKIRNNAGKFNDHRTAPHTWLQRYDNALSNNADHRTLGVVCNTNAQEAFGMAQKNGMYWANHKLWNTLGKKHISASH